MHTEFWWGKLKAEDRLEYMGVNGKALLIWIFKKVVFEV
jgi:hypothetical protein